MRTARLLGIIMELSRTPSTSVSALAERFEVSDRTMQRDLSALHGLGIPIWTRPGPAGGVGLVEGWRSPITGMTGPEVHALLIGQAGSRDLGLAEDFGTARLKMLTTNAAVGKHAQSADEAFLNDNEHWFSTAERPNALSAVAEAVWEAQRLTIRYARHGETPKQRLVDPLGLVLKTDRWYLVAAHRQTPLTFQVSRIRSAVLNDEPVRRPQGFSLAGYWDEFTSAFEASLHTLPVRLSVPENSVEALLANVPGSQTREAVDNATSKDRRIWIDLLLENTDIAVAQLLGVPGVEVHRPAGLRHELHVRAQDITQRNAPRHRNHPEHRPA